MSEVDAMEQNTIWDIVSVRHVPPPINRWRHLLVNGDKSQIDHFLEEVERRFDALGWKRDRDFEGKLNGHPDQINEFRCWTGKPTNDLHPRLCLNRTTGRRVRGGSFDF